MIRLPFRAKLFAALALLVTAALVAALLVIRSETERRVDADFGVRFERTLAAFRQLQELRRNVVRDEVNTLARGNPQFRTVLSSASIAADDLGFGGGPSREDTLRDANLRLRSLLPSLAVAERYDVFAVASATGELVYSRAAPERFGDALADVPPIPAAMVGDEAVALWGRAADRARALPLVPGPGVFDVVAEPIAFGDELHGLVLVGTRVDRRTLDGMRAISGLHVVLLGEDGAVASTLDEPRTEALVASLRRGASAVRALGTGAVEERAFAGGRWLVARAEIVPGAGTDPLALAVVASVDEELAFLPALQWSFIALGAGILAIALAVAFALARGVARPVATLARAAERVGRGDLGTRVEIASGDELEELGGAFNHMVEGLRERDHIRHTFERHVSRDVAEELLRNPDVAAARGARRDVTVFFSDLAGYTALAEAHTPETVVACLNEYFEAICDSVLATGGTVNDLVGDGILASWGAPIAHPDHAARACRAALLAGEKLGALAARWRARGLPALRWRVGIHSGSVVAGEMGTAERSKYGIIGDAVNVASRLEGANKWLGTVVLVSEATRAELGAEFELCEIDTIRVAGRTTPIRVFELLGAKGHVAADRLAARDRYEAALAAYRARDFPRAAALLDACAMRERALRYAAYPPPADWDAVFDAPKD